MASRLLRAAYRLRHHHWGRWSLDQWLIWLLAAAALYCALFWQPRPPGWLLAGLLLVLAGGLSGLGSWAASRSYVKFSAANPLPAAPQPRPLAPEDKVLAHATGHFEVQGKAHFFAELLAYWRSFASREHAVMAIVHESRFLLLGTVPEEDVGMWYIFFQPAAIVSILPGGLAFGRCQRPALQVIYHVDPPRKRRLFFRRPRQPLRRTIYLSFDGEADRARVWADLLV